MSAHAYCLCPRGSNSVRGIARGAKADEVLVTVQNDGVVCYSSARQEQSSSWALGSQHLKVLSATADGSTLAVVCTIKGTGSPQLELYDLTGGKPMGTHVIPQPANNAKLASASLRDQQLICLWSGGLLQAFNISGMGHLALLFNDAVWSISAQAQPATLASLVGALNLRSLDSNPAARAAVRALGEEECTSSSTPPQLEHARPSWTQSLAQSREASSSGYHNQAPIAIPATVSWQLAASSQQAQLLEQQLTQQLSAGWSDKDTCRRFISDLMESCSESKVHLSSDIVASTAAFLTQKQWWGALEALLRRHALPALAQCPGLVLAMVQAGRFSVLPGMLHKAKNLPREELIAILQLLLSPATPAMEGHCKQHQHWLRKLAVTAVESAEGACLAHIRTEGELTSIDAALQEKVVKAAYAAAAVDGMTAQEVCLHPIVTMAHDSQVLMSSLRQLSPPQALTLAQYLLKLLGKFSDSLNDVMPASLEESKSPLRIPKMQQVLEWLSLLFDAHITSLHRHPASAKVLSQLKDKLRSKLLDSLIIVVSMSQIRPMVEDSQCLFLFSIQGCCMQVTYGML
ncbi:hypothetical protein WJX79_005995 [Trebouxia sp. C0005]